MHYPNAKANIEDQKSMRKSLRNHATSAESALWRVLKSRNVNGLKFRRQQGIGPYVLDFYCAELKLCVELDGSSHDYKYEYDERRTMFLSQQGIRVIRFRNEMVWTNLDYIMSEIIAVAKEIAQDIDPAKEV